jgi:hypothetical protein
MKSKISVGDRATLASEIATLDDRKGWRLAALEIERAVAIAAQHILSDVPGFWRCWNGRGSNHPR